MRIYLHHLKAAHNCTRGGRRWARRYGFDWSEFLKHGVDAEEVRATGDALGLQVVAIAESEKQESGRGR